MILLYDIDPVLCQEWSRYFAEVLNTKVEIKNIPFSEVEYEKVVTAGNSYGWMTGGIDLAVRNYYGQWIQDRVQSEILNQPGRYLPVGRDIIISTQDRTKPFLIYAPTMDIPRYITKTDVFYVFAKLLERHESFACCGLGTGTGKVSAKDCAEAMFNAYKFIIG